MTTFQVLLHPDAAEFLEFVDEKAVPIITENLSHLVNSPFPGRGRGEKERLIVDDEHRYRMHIEHTWAAAYDIYDTRQEVRVLEILPIAEVHERYGPKPFLHEGKFETVGADNS